MSDMSEKSFLGRFFSKPCWWCRVWCPFSVLKHAPIRIGLPLSGGHGAWERTRFRGTSWWSFWIATGFHHTTFTWTMVTMVTMDFCLQSKPNLCSLSKPLSCYSILPEERDSEFMDQSSTNRGPRLMGNAMAVSSGKLHHLRWGWGQIWWACLHIICMWICMWYICILCKYIHIRIYVCSMDIYIYICIYIYSGKLHRACWKNVYIHISYDVCVDCCMYLCMYTYRQGSERRSGFTKGPSSRPCEYNIKMCLKMRIKQSNMVGLWDLTNKNGLKWWFDQMVI
jgi:hypothetical protein